MELGWNLDLPDSQACATNPSLLCFFTSVLKSEKLVGKSEVQEATQGCVPSPREFVSAVVTLEHGGVEGEQSTRNLSSFLPSGPLMFPALNSALLFLPRN
jgi:hypothetical protein